LRVSFYGGTPGSAPSPPDPATRKWQDRSGQDRDTTEVALRFNGEMSLLDSRGEGGGGYEQDRGGGIGGGESRS
jgi:single-stranded DNA-binding protein